MTSKQNIIVCLGYPPLQTDSYIQRLRDIDPRIEVSVLPVDAGTNTADIPPHEPHDEPPPWAASVEQERRRALQQAEVMIALHAPNDLMTHAPNLRWLQGIGAGVDQFAVAGVAREKTVVSNASGVSAGSMSEFVIGRLLQIWKRFPETEQHQRAHQYVRTYGRSFVGSVVGIVGMGSIGRALALRAKAMGVKVLGLKRSGAKPGPDSELADKLYGPEGLHDMLAECDAVVVAAPASPETHHLINDKALAAMKPGCVLVNVARGSLVDTPALLDALASGQISAAALDVFEEEPLPESSPLWDTPNIYISAHSSVSVDRYIDDVFDLFEENLRRYVNGEALRNLIDMEALGFK